MKILVTLLSITIALLFATCAESPVEPTELTIMQKYTKTLTQTGYWVWDAAPVYLDFNIDGTGEMTMVNPVKRDTGPIILSYEWTLSEEDEKIYLDAEPLFWFEIISLDNNEMILFDPGQNKNFAFDYQHN
jgi:hypothetical protein